MRRVDRQINSHEDIVDILKRCDTIRLGLHGDKFPYVVPLSFGFEDADEEISIYFHGAQSGLKHELLSKNNHVCVEASIFHGYASTDSSGLTTKYESVICYGTASLIFGKDAVQAINLICTHCGFDGYNFDHSQIEHIKVYKITLAQITAKRNLF